MKQRLFISKDIQNNKLIDYKLLFDDEFSEHYIIDEPPVMEVIAGKEGRYELDEDGNVVVVYYDVQMTESEKIKALEKRIEDLTKSIEEFYKLMSVKKVTT
ncbi:hypothetical protein [Zhenhengia yiwuensis]|uniref:Uncharacterized protein n=1 Tax=Zhenhengia yiwuensis TaxID=2763666 RepID=A0A926I8W5_9FIRM|nr:hypothetical protein [Zhenhengia yiwuensis]MBC8579125.1 hypothetical protein [Zhenhengia yiwuensis]